MIRIFFHQHFRSIAWLIYFYTSKVHFFSYFLITANNERMKFYKVWESVEKSKIEDHRKSFNLKWSRKAEYWCWKYFEGSSWLNMVWVRRSLVFMVWFSTSLNQTISYCLACPERLGRVCTFQGSPKVQKNKIIYFYRFFSMSKFEWQINVPFISANQIYLLKLCPLTFRS